MMVGGWLMGDVIDNKAWWLATTWFVGCSVLQVGQFKIIIRDGYD